MRPSEREIIQIMTYELYYRYRHDHTYPWTWKWYASAQDLVELDAHMSKWVDVYEDVPLESQTILDFGEGDYGVNMIDLYDGKLVEGEVRLLNAV